ncbi:MAG: diguanylate cyclase [Gemmatimonadetes bacterium]|nr:diguanylate cyclase [Gemmatimonadota bacterium]
MLSRLIDRLGIVRTAAVMLLASVALSMLVTAAMMLLFVGEVHTIAIVLSAAVPAVAAPPSLFLLLRLVAELRTAREELRRLSIIDPLSGAFNRRHMVELAEAEVARACRYGDPFSVLMLDLDDFKAVNDRHGHVAGDQVIRAVSDLCRALLRDNDVFARVGGDEFVVLLPQTDAARAAETAERLRARIAVESVAWHGESVPLRASIGIAAFDPAMGGLNDLLAAADRALLAAKRRGKNQAGAAAQSRRAQVA